MPTSTALSEYLLQLDALKALRSTGGDEESEQEDLLLDRMDAVWFRLTDDEWASLDKREEKNENQL